MEISLKTFGVILGVVYILYMYVCMEHLNKLNQSINQPINQSINRSINQSINRSIDRSIDRSINQSRLRQ